MTTKDAPDADGDRRAELLAAVRAVESGERPAASFFAQPSAPTAPPTRPAPGPRTNTPDTPAPAVPEDLPALLTAGGAPASLAPAVTHHLGASADQVLREDPWRLLSVPGPAPEQVDEFARALLGDACGPHDPRRVTALVEWMLRRAALRGDTAVEPGTLADALRRHAVPDPEEALRHLAEDGEVLFLEDGVDALQVSVPEDESAPRATDPAEDEGAPRPVRLLVALERYAQAEESLAEGLARLASTLGSGPHWEPAPDAAPSSAGELIRASAGHGVVLHSGGATSLAEPVALLQAARSQGLRVLSASHTTSGRDRVTAQYGTPPDSPTPSESSPPVAATVGGLLAGSEGPQRSEEGLLPLDLLVLPDAPLLDVEAAASLVEALPDGARLVLAGDPHLLAEGTGRMFADLLTAGVCPLVTSRTPDPGPLGELTSSVAVGELPAVDAPGRELVTVPVQDPGEAVHRTTQLVADSVPRALGIPSADTVVITPGPGGGAGATALNAALKQALNPGPGRFDGFDPDDRVVYAEGPGPSRLGVVRDAEEGGLRLDLDGEPRLVPRERVRDTLRHGWAVTARQAAGRRWPAAVVVLPGDAGEVLTRQWVYTAFTRAERHLSVVQGAGPALPQAVAERLVPERTTRLRPLLASTFRSAEGQS
ncbi:helix-hairpin-helix domain-containing protein [Streptomyces sp. NPDC005438]|uniref:helix-hairpin-helix domain-containing protein n=1 Tax=Streptomyces sp. NPDC005438 TaxID=3156880 RepID=UPI0033A50EEE